MTSEDFAWHLSPEFGPCLGGLTQDLADALWVHIGGDAADMQSAWWTIDVPEIAARILRSGPKFWVLDTSGRLHDTHGLSESIRVACHCLHPGRI